jgi:hypothetical protein
MRLKIKHQFINYHKNNNEHTSMKHFPLFFATLIFTTVIFSFSAHSQNAKMSNQATKPETNLHTLGYQYFTAWSATQSPTAKLTDIDNYLSLLKDNIGHQHLPYDADDSREEDGKNAMRKGMQFYLGSLLVMT